MSDDVLSVTVPKHCDPDNPPAGYREYRDWFDMDDTEEELAYWNHLRPRLEVCKDEILRAYHAADTEALRHQKRHRRLANAAAFFGTVAVLLAIFQAAFHELVERLAGWSVATLETVSAVAALIAVIIGVV